MEKVPYLYPRGIDEIKKFYVDTNVEKKKN